MTALDSPSAMLDTETRFNLPTELECLIFETTAIRHPGSIPRLLRVAKRVLEWTEPFLYRTIELHIFASDKRVSSGALLKRIQVMTKRAEFSPSVHNLEIISFEWTFFAGRSQNVWSDHDLRRVLGACTHIQNLLLVGKLESKPIFPLLKSTTPTRIILITDLTSPIIDFTRPQTMTLPWDETCQEMRGSCCSCSMGCRIFSRQRDRTRAAWMSCGEWWTILSRVSGGD
ncbi:hypothetical protein FB45DRAFT_935937 [Roridomyces roridus]|uniref:Uncharacterized protein n=1 Tax=Roridomyces roridus TaxID=1738132 RepID=A0AAD7BAG6_9AGAR|nr:hypothetical protein FB45DRAFT_935937 [Roridomyces roridus]